MTEQKQSENIQKLKELLRELFQFENSDLDFGIYRIINIKRKEIESFIDKELIEIVRSEINLNKSNQISLETINKMKKEIESTFGCNIDQAKIEYSKTPKINEYLNLENEFKKINDITLVEEEIYNLIYNFFSRYYDKGDIISQRRYSKTQKYAIPYNGEEIYFYWANRDQYYTKTGELFKNYIFNSKGYKIEFHMVNEDIDVEKGNILDTEKKFFIVKSVKSPSKYNIIIGFSYRGLTKEENDEITENIKESKKSKAKNPKIEKEDLVNRNIKIIIEQLSIINNDSVKILKEKHINMNGEQSEKNELEWHIDKYSTKNTNDYFIHRDLKSFLKQELEFFIKNDIFQLDEIETTDILNLDLKKIKTFKQISLKIIEFLAQIEEFHKKIWEKKKFVINTDYCITLDYINEKFYPEILKNSEQLKEWKKLFAFDIEIEIKKIKDGLAKFDKNISLEPVNILKKFTSLLIDTKFFNEDFKFQILEEIDDLEEKTTGILINSDNFAALNLLLNKYRNKVKCCYIDPPYNAKSSEILYKNNFKHSSWLSLMENRLTIAKQFLNDNGVFVIAIDDNEQEKLGLMLDLIFPDKAKTCITVQHNPGGTQGDNFAYTHEYAYFIYPQPGSYIGLENREDNADVRQFMNTAKGNTTNYLRSTGATCFYPVLIKDEKILGFGEVCKDDFHPKANVKRPDGIIEVYPIDKDNVERKWVVGRKSVENEKDNLSVRLNKKRNVFEIIRTKSELNYKTVWIDSKYSAKMYGTQILTDLFGAENKSFTFPKSIHLVKNCINAAMNNELDGIVIDFFAGSGTTGQAVIEMNEENENKYKIILVEMAEYFNSALKPRILKCIYSKNWKNGIPQDTNGSHKQIIKYHLLEQYEDSIKNLDFVIPNTLVLETKDYKLKYMLKFESKLSKVFLNLDALENPFEYTLDIEIDNEMKTKNVDLIETFNYIAGIFVSRIFKLKNEGNSYIVVIGFRGEKKSIIIWRNKKNPFDAHKDREFIEKNIIKNEKYDEILINGNSLVKEAKSIDNLFKISMLGED